MSDSQPVSKILLATGVLFAGICWYLSFSLTAHTWYTLWVAPIPILYFSLRLSGKWAFAIAFAGYLLGRLSWVPYLLSVLPMPLVLIFTLILPLIFALLVIAARKIMLTYTHWSTVFAFPVLFTTFEYLLFLYSRDGTVGSIAYTQNDFLPVVQVASLAGIQGITFLATFFPAAIALILFRYKNKLPVRTLSFVTVGILVATMAFGIIRLSDTPSAKKSVRVGMATIDEQAYHRKYVAGEDRNLHLANLYLQEVAVLAKQGAKVVVFPEKMFTVQDTGRPVILQMFKDSAIAHQVFIIASVANKKADYYENRAWVISDEGKLIADYQKVHLFEGEVLDTVRPGKERALFHRNGATEGVAICKDMDFQQYILGYGKSQSNLLYVPAWDFVVDGWMHSRMAIMRSVEGGFGMIRNARQGRLTINDYRGKVLFEANGDNGTPTLLTGTIDAQYHTTLYSRWGDWFSIINAVAAVLCMLLLVRKK
ncbi:nitrilase-related carbon-nitrogen hydrolase [Chitinophaga sp. RAB17]|uniref:nitrilase-related carbon-nitrogen hydrolase n=1 Tax=Chitinophaga sp. RAB17 TaxID=3233049 RepID=UPI003F8F23C0